MPTSMSARHGKRQQPSTQARNNQPTNSVVVGVTAQVMPGCQGSIGPRTTFATPLHAHDAAAAALANGRVEHDETRR